MMRNIVSYSKMSTHKVVGDVYENDIIKMVPHNKNARITKINSQKNNWINVFKSNDIVVLGHCIDKYGNHYITGYFDRNIVIKNRNNIFNCYLSEEGFTDVFVAKMKNNKITYIKPITGIKSDSALDIQIDNHNDIYICGYYTDSITFNTIYLSNDNEEKHMFVAKMNGKTWEWIWAIDALGYSSICKKILVLNNHIYACGTYQRDIEFNIVPSIRYTSNSENNIFYIKLDALNGDIENIECSEKGEIIDIIIKNNNKICLLINTDNNITFMDRKLEVNGMIIIEIDVDNNNIINYKTFRKRIGRCMTIIHNNLYVVCKNYFMKLNYMYDIEWENDIDVSSIIGDIKNIIYVSGKYQDSIKINNHVYNNKGNNTFLLKLSTNNFVIDFNIYPSLIEEIKLYYYDNEIHISGYINGIYSIIKYIPDDRDNHCLGIVRTPNYSKDGTMVDVDFSGNISVGYKDLKPGYDYYIQDDGGIDIQVNDYYFGTALSNDKLLIKR